MSAGTTIEATKAAPAALHAVRTGQRIEDVLDRLATTGDPAARAAAEETVQALMDFYGAGLARMLHLLSTPVGRRTPGDPLAGLLGDELVASLLVLHDLHPEDRTTRITRALDSVRDHELDVVDFDEGQAGTSPAAGRPEAADAAARRAVRRPSRRPRARWPASRRRSRRSRYRPPAARGAHAAPDRHRPRQPRHRRRPGSGEGPVNAPPVPDRPRATPGCAGS